MVAGDTKSKRTLPDSPAPRSSILISFLAIMRSRLIWFSISSLPEGKGDEREEGGEKGRGGSVRVYSRALASSSMPEDWTQPIVKRREREKGGGGQEWKERAGRGWGG